MDVSIIIVNYHTSELIAGCVDSIIEKTRGLEYEVIVVDNNSEPDFESIIAQRIAPHLIEKFHFISLPENIGFGRANNEGLKISSGRNIFFLNPDTILLNNAIKILSDFLDHHPKAGACGGNLFDMEMKPIHSFKRILPGIFCETNELLNNIPVKIIFGKNRNHNHTTQIIKVGYITGADLMVKRSVVLETGGFCDDYFMYFEETDLCAGIKRYGKEIYSVPEAKIQHLEGKSFSETEAFESEFKTRLLEKSRKIYYKRNKSKLNTAVSNFIYYFFLTSRAVLIKNKRKKAYYKLRREAAFNKNY